MKILRDNKGFSTIEGICYFGYAVLGVIAVIIFLLFCRTRFQIGNDTRMVITALRDAQSDVVGANCIVRGCSGGADCTHWSNGVNFAYFNNVSNSLNGEKMQGYNEYVKMKIDNRTYYGDRDTMIIRISYDGENFSADWVKGK